MVAFDVGTAAVTDPADSAKMMRNMLGPQAVDRLIRHAISTCWMMLPEDKRTAEAVEHEVRRLVDRALANLREDARTFAPSPASKPARKRRKKGGA